MTHVLKILPQVRPTYSTWSISWLLMSWRRKSHGISSRDIDLVKPRLPSRRTLRVKLEQHPLWAWDSLTWNTESIPTRSLFTWWHMACMDNVQNVGFYPVFYRSIGVITTIAAKENNNNAWLRLCSIVNRGKTNLSWTRTWSFPKRFGFRFLLGTSICHVVFFFRKLHAYCDELHVAAREPSPGSRVWVVTTLSVLVTWSCNGWAVQAWNYS